MEALGKASSRLGPVSTSQPTCAQEAGSPEQQHTGASERHCGRMVTLKWVLSGPGCEHIIIPFKGFPNCRILNKQVFKKIGKKQILMSTSTSKTFDKFICDDVLAVIQNTMVIYRY